MGLYNANSLPYGKATHEGKMLMARGIEKLVGKGHAECIRRSRKHQERAKARRALKAFHGLTVEEAQEELWGCWPITEAAEPPTSSEEEPRRLLAVSSEEVCGCSMADEDRHWKMLAEYELEAPGSPRTKNRPASESPRTPGCPRGYKSSCYHFKPAGWH